MDLLQEIGEIIPTITEWVNITINGLKETFAPITISESDQKSLIYQATIGVYKEIVVPLFVAFGIPEILIHIVAIIGISIAAITAVQRFLNWLERIWPFRW